MSVQTKVCANCKLEYPISSFYKNLKASDKLRSWCKTCCNVQHKKYLELHPRKPNKSTRVEMSDDHAVWYFYNNCRASKRYPRLEFTNLTHKFRPFRKIKCIKCGRDMVSYGNRIAMIDHAKGQICYSCRIRELNDFNINCINENTKKSKLLAEKFKHTLQSCKTLGTCDILHAHHTTLIEDPERLTSEFLIGLICGNDKVKKYNNLNEVSL